MCAASIRVNDFPPLDAAILIASKVGICAGPCVCVFSLVWLYAKVSVRLAL